MKTIDLNADIGEADNPDWAASEAAILRYIFNTPSHHRVHHSVHPTHLDRNYAGIFIIWDRMFGTFVEEGDDEIMTYGLVKNIETFNPARVAFAEWLALFRDAFGSGLSWSQRLRYIFAPPGYSHDGSRKGSEAILADWQAEQGDSRP